MDVQAVILAGGKGTRLRPITDELPKPLVPVANRPLILHQLAHLARAGVRDVTLALGYAAEAFTGVERDAAELGIDLTLITEPAPLGTGGALRWCADEGAFDPDRPLLWLNGDVIAAPDIGALTETHLDRGARITFWLTSVRDVREFGVLELGSDGFVERFLEKPMPDETDSHLVNAGIVMLDPRIIDRVPPDAFFSFEKQLLPGMVRERELVFGRFDGGYWKDTGRPLDYRKANRHVLEGRVDWEPAGEQAAPGLWLGAGVKRDGVDLIQPAAIGDDTVLEEGARLFGRTVVGQRCHVARAAELDGCVLFDDVVVERGASVIDSVVCRGARIERGAVVHGAIVGHDTVVGPANEVRETRLGPGLTIPPEALLVDQQRR